MTVNMIQGYMKPDYFTILRLGAASLTKGSLVPFLNAVTLRVWACLRYWDLILRPSKNKNINQVVSISSDRIRESFLVNL